MYLLVEIFFFGVLPLAFALWQIHDVRREQRRRNRRPTDTQGDTSGDTNPDAD